MELNIAIILSMTLMLSLTQCLDQKNSDKNMANYQSHLKNFEETQNVIYICNAANSIGNIQKAFPISIKERKRLFIEHVKTSLDAAHVQGLGEKDWTCTYTLWQDLYVQKTAIIQQSRDMMTCMDNARVNGIYTSQAYDNCAAKYNYVP